MILNTEQLKNACAKILTAIDNSSDSSLTDILELKTENNILYLNVTNKEYFVKVKLGELNEDFHATINADVFLRLISQTSTEEIELTLSDTALKLKADGNYKFALIYDNTQLLNLPEITIMNPTVNFSIDSAILNSILVNNSKELSKLPKGNKIAVNPLQRMYYLDEQGAITFYDGACVNKFELEKPVKLLLNGNLVRLFSLFKNTSVKFTLGYDALSNDIIQTKVKFETDDIIITAVLNCDDVLLKSMPVKAIRDRAFNDYPYNVTINRKEFLSAIQRLLLFVDNESAVGLHKTCGRFTFTKGLCLLSDFIKENTEEVKYANELNSELQYDMILDLTSLRLALESNTDQYITVNFGDHVGLVVAKDNIYTVVAELNEA